MAEFIDRLKASIGTLTGGLTWGQRAGLLLLVGALVTLFAMTVNVAATPEERRLVGSEERELHKKVIETLTAIQVEPILKNGEIWVKSEEFERASLELAGSGILGDSKLFDWLNENNITSTRWQNDKRWQVALQNKLAAMLRKMDAIEAADVVYTPPSQTNISLGTPSGRARATVNVKARTGKSISTGVATAIAAIVSHGVEGMKREDVAVIDTTTGTVIPVPGEGEQLYESFYLQELEVKTADWVEAKVHQLLGISLPRFSVAARVRFNSDYRERFTQRTDEEKSFVLNVLKEKASEKQYPVGSDPSTVAKGSLTLELGSAGPYREKDASTLETEPQSSFDNSKHLWNVGSDVENISVAVMIPNDIFGEGYTDQQRADIAAVIKKSVEHATGIGDPKRLQVDVTPIPSFIVAPPLLEVTFMEEAAAYLRENGGILLLWLLAAVALVLVYRFMRSAIEKKRTEDLVKAVTKAAEETPEFKDWEEAEAVAERLRAQIREMVSKNPRAVAGVIKRWMGQS